MKLTKHEHACVVLEKDGASIVIDPGSFSSGAAEIIAGRRRDPDHPRALRPRQRGGDQRGARRPARTCGCTRPPRSAACSPRTRTSSPPVAAGDELTVGSFAVTVHGSEHAVIHPDIPVIANVGYLIDGSRLPPG